MNILKTAYFLFFAFIFLILTGYGVLLYTKKITPAFSPEQELANIVKVSTATPLEVFRNNISDILRRGGIDGAFQLAELAFHRGALNIDECHTILHLVGHYAYARSSDDFAKLARTDGLLCVSSFIHGVEAEIALEGKDKVPDLLKNYCFESKKAIPGFWCYHGAGHAFLENRMDVSLALQQCDALAGGPEPNLSNCYRGVFSQYGSAALGYDGDTGLPLSSKPLVAIDFKKPLLFCDTFEEKYHNSCYSQLTKIHASQGNSIEDLTKGCLVPTYTREAKLICIQIVAGVSARSQLNNKETVSPESFILALASDFHQSYIDGALDGFLSHAQSGKKKDWKTFCNAFPQESDREYCLKFNP